MSEYTDCEIYISNSDQAEVRLGNWVYSGKPNLGKDLETALRNLPLDPRLYGTTLFHALFPLDDNLLVGYRAALAIARHQNKVLRFRLHIAENAPEALHSIDWERIYDPKLKMRLARSANLVFSRYVGVNDVNDSVPVEGSPKILVIVSSPSNISESGLAALNRDSIYHLIKDAVSSIRGAEVKLFEGSVTGAKIREELVRGGYDILHLHAHALLSKDNQMIRLMLEKEDGEYSLVDEEFLREVFDGTESLRLINLTACNSGRPMEGSPFSGLALSLVQLGCPAVIAMRKAIGIESAAHFTEHFYKRLAQNGNVDSAANEARRQVWLSNNKSQDWSIPTNFVRLPEGKIWNVPERGHTQIIGQPDAFWQPILQWVKLGKVVPIIGPDINKGQLLSNKEITEFLAKTYEYGSYNYPSNNRNDLPRVAGFVETMTSQKYPHGQLVELIKTDLLEREKIQEREMLDSLDLREVITRISQKHFDADKDDSHRILAQLPLSTYLTTNSDNLMMQALRFVNKNPKEGVCLWHEGEQENKDYKQLRGTTENPLVFHLYGTAQNPASLVLTEDDYLTFLRSISGEPWRLPIHIRSTLTESMLLFLGFNVRDLDFRILIKGVIEQLKKSIGLGRMIVLQIEPGDDLQQTVSDVQHLQNYLDQDCTNLQVKPCWLSLREFLIELRDRLPKDK